MMSGKQIVSLLSKAFICKIIIAFELKLKVRIDLSITKIEYHVNLLHSVDSSAIANVLSRQNFYRNLVHGGGQNELYATNC